MGERDPWVRSTLLIASAAAVVVMNASCSAAPPSQQSARTAASMTANLPLFEGTYRLDFDSAQASYTGKRRMPLKHAGIESKFFAFSPSCVQVCSVLSLQLYDDLRPIDGPQFRRTFVYLVDRWELHTSQTMETRCDNHLQQTVVPQWWIYPPMADGTLRGDFMFTAESEGCLMDMGDTIRTPFVGTRVGPVAPGVF
ncbi:hypothetical protein [Mycobacterium asiaticum]|uniref:hypothetical protein n=1 Tax=Mycobacterium asiaticum TaxID=1790 RepID=UPI0012DAFFB7|nr:hypothetical protein [Mycobacterium asiaticum]